jgi:uncharacterized protein (UPF0212 family)
MNLLDARATRCPHCGETIELTLDLSVPSQSYIEDCPVCCRPIEVTYEVSDGEIIELTVETSS